MYHKFVVCALLILLPLFSISCQKGKQTHTIQGSSLQLEELKGLNDSRLKDLYNTRMKQGKTAEAAALSLVLGNRSRSVGDYQSAMEYHQQSLDAALQNKDYLLAANAYNNLGTNARRLQAMALAHNYYLKALSLLQKHPCSRKSSDCLDVRSHNSNGLGNLYLDMGEAKQAKFFFNMALEIAEERQDHVALAINFANLGAIAELEKQDSLAMTLYLKSLEQNRLSSNDKGIALCFGHLARLYEKMGQERLASVFYLAAYEQLLENPDKWHRLLSMVPLLEYYLRVGKRADFDALISEAKQLAKEVNSPQHLFKIDNMLAETAADDGDYKHALEHTQKANEWRRLAESNDSVTLSNVLRLQYEQQMANEQVSYFENASQRSSERAAMLEKVLFVFLLLTTTLIVLYILLWRQHRKNLHEQAVKDKLRLDFMELFSNEIMSPLTLLAELNKRMSKPEIRLEDLCRDVSLLSTQERSVHQLVRQVMEYARLTLTPEEKLKSTLIDVVGYTRMACESYFNQAALRSVHCNFSSDVNSLYVRIYLPYFDGLIANILNIFLLHCETGDNINCTINQRSHKGYFQFSIWSNSNSLNDLELQDVLNFSELSNSNLSESNVGARFLLFKLYADRLNSMLKLQNQANEPGVSISINIPIGNVRERELSELMGHADRSESMISAGKKHEALLQLSVDELQQRASSPPADAQLQRDLTLDADTQSKKEQIVLLDNDKQMGDYVSKMLASNYQVTVLRELEHAKDYVREQLPDLVISNVRLPMLNGWELVEDMRRNASTKKIPVIAISASNSADDKLRYLKSGVQIHLEMPFDSELLVTHVKSLLENVQASKMNMLSELFKGKLPSDLGNKEAVDFMIQLSDIISANLSNDKLGPAFLADRMKISVSSLNRRLNALAGSSCKAFITSMRIESSKQKLRDTEMSVADIAAQIGFYDLPHFSRTFKSVTGSTPSDYRKVSRIAQMNGNGNSNL